MFSSLILLSIVKNICIQDLFLPSFELERIKAERVIWATSLSARNMAPVLRSESVPTWTGVGLSNSLPFMR